LRNYKVLFLIPSFVVADERYRRKGAKVPHAGIAYLAAALKAEGVPFAILDMNLGYSDSNALEYIGTYQPDMICMTMYSYGHSKVNGLVDRVRTHYDGTIVVGGPHVSIAGGKVLEESSADFAVEGEGEYTLLELVQSLCGTKEREEIPGLIWRRGNQVVVNERRPPIEDLDALPFPAYEHFELEKYLCSVDRRLPLLTSRGCPYRCSFCCTRLSMGNRFRKRSAEDVIGEIQYWYEKGWSVFDVNDDIFSLDRDRAMKICTLIVERRLDIRFNFYVGLRVDTVDEELLAAFKAAGCTFISYGCESGNDRVLKAIRKGITVEDVTNAVRITKKVGINHKVNFIIGHPTETYNDAMDTIRLARHLKCSFVRVYNLLPYPGTEAFEWIAASSSARFLYPPAAYLNGQSRDRLDILFETDEFTAEERRKVLLSGFRLGERTLAQFRFGKLKGYVVYLLNRNRHASRMGQKLLDTLLRTGVGSTLYDALVKNPWNPPKTR